MPKGDNRLHHLTQEQRMELRDRFAMRALPWCLMFSTPATNFHELAKTASERAYIIADQMLAARGLMS